jgi:hypothetical protein
MNEMNPVEALALKKVTATKAQREEVSPGVHTGTFLAEISYELTVGEDYEQRIVAKADPWLLFATAMSKLNGVTVESIVREAMESGLDAKAVKKSASEAMQAVKEPTMTQCKGKVTGDVTVTPLRPE